MNDRFLIYCGLMLFIALVTFPVWQGLAMHSSTEGPGVKKVVGRKSCVLPLDSMRSAHMDFLMEWRDGKVREQKRLYTAYDGKVYPVSLTDICLTQCHGSKDQFCDRCHAYAGVPATDCWGCHVSPPRDATPLAATNAGGL